MTSPRCGDRCPKPVAYHLTTDCGCIDGHVCEEHATAWFRIKVLMAGGKGLWCVHCQRDVQLGLEEMG